MKKIANGDYSFELKFPLDTTQFLPNEGVDRNNKVSYDRNSLSVINTLHMVNKLDRLFNRATEVKEIKSGEATMQELYRKRFGKDYVTKIASQTKKAEDTYESSSDSCTSSSSDSVNSF